MKTSRNVWLMGVLVCSSLLLGAVSAQAMDIPVGKWWTRPDMVSALSLTQYEITALETSNNTLHATISPLIKQLRTDKTALEQAIAQNPASVTPNSKVFTTVEADIQDLAVPYLTYMVSVSSILGPDRFAKLMTMQHKRFRDHMMKAWDHEQ
jgi:hypothetical protein